MGDWIYNLFSGIIGAILGVLGVWYWQWRIEKKQVAAIKTLIIIDIENNIEALNKFYTGIINKKVEYQYKEVIWIDRVLEQDLPCWKRSVWDEKSVLMARALSKEKIIEIEKFHDLLSKISKFHQKCRSLKKEEKEKKLEGSNKSTHEIMENMVFTVNQEELWQEFDELVQEILKFGRKITSKL